MLVKRTEQIWLKPSAELSSLCHISKNLYNEANYIIRQEFINNGKWIRYNTLAHKLKDSENYKILPAQTSQQIIKLLDKSWKSFFKAIKVWKNDKSKFKTQPKLPGYKEKDGEHMLVFTNQQAKIKNKTVIFPKKAKLDPIKTRIKELKEIRLIPKGLGYCLEIVYDKEINPKKTDETRVAGIDIGVNNLVTIANNIGKKSIVIKGGIAKSINQYYNKRKAELQSKYDLQKIKSGTKLKRLHDKRNKKVHDQFHKVSKTVITWCKQNNIGQIIIGHNKDWKQKINIGKRNNQTFVSLPFNKLIHQISYKAEEAGIKTKEQEEAHTSKCSFFDNEAIEHHKKYVGKRTSRGLFRTKDKHIINADVNGALNIIKKAIPNAFNANGIEGVVDHPLRLEVLM